MRKIMLLVTALFIICSCSMDDGGERPFHVEILPVSEVTNIPRFFTPGRTYDLKAIYEKPSSCHISQEFHCEKEANITTLWLQTLVVEDPECDDELQQMVMEEMSYKYVCPTNYTATSCTFRFYSGNDEQGNPVYIEKQVPVRQY